MLREQRIRSCQGGVSFPHLFLNYEMALFLAFGLFMVSL